MVFYICHIYSEHSIIHNSISSFNAVKQCFLNLACMVAILIEGSQHSFAIRSGTKTV